MDPSYHPGSRAGSAVPAPSSATLRSASPMPHATDCHRFYTDPVNPPRLGSRQKNHREAIRNASAAPSWTQPPRRRVWDMIVFGFELQMLQCAAALWTHAINGSPHAIRRLHLETLHEVVQGFLVSEASICFQALYKRRLPTRHPGCMLLH